MMGAAGAAESKVLLKTITWSTNYIDTATISGVDFTANENSTSSSSSCVSVSLPSVTTTGFYFDFQLIEGYSSYINAIGVANITSDFNFLTSTNHTSWYWGNTIYGLGNGVSGPGVLTAGTHRIAVRSESGTPKVYFRKDAPTGTIAGPFTAPSGTLYVCVCSQGGYKIGDVKLLNGGDVYQGGGGLF